MAFNPISLVSVTTADPTFSTLGATVHNAGVTNILTGNAGRFILEGAGPVVGDDAGATFTGTGATFVATLNGLTVTAAPTFSALTSGQVMLSGTAGLTKGDTGLTFSGTGTNIILTSGSYNAAGATTPANGMFLFTTNQLGFSAQSVNLARGLQGQWLFKANTIVGWDSNNVGDGADTGFARPSAGVLNLGNGVSAASKSGTLQLATLNVGTSVIPASNGVPTLGAASNGFGALYLDYTNTATVGAVTINKPSGRVIMAAAGSSFTLTNSLITANSHIFLSADSAPGNVVAVQFYAVPGAGSCTINAVPAVTNQTNIDFLVINAD